MDNVSQTTLVDNFVKLRGAEVSYIMSRFARNFIKLRYTSYSVSCYHVILYKITGIKNHKNTLV
jgi:hypothetical protein